MAECSLWFRRFLASDAYMMMSIVPLMHIRKYKDMQLWTGAAKLNAWSNALGRSHSLCWWRKRGSYEWLEWAYVHLWSYEWMKITDLQLVYGSPYKLRCVKAKLNALSYALDRWHSLYDGRNTWSYEGLNRAIGVCRMLLCSNINTPTRVRLKRWRKERLKRWRKESLHTCVYMCRKMGFLYYEVNI